MFSFQPKWRRSGIQSLSHTACLCWRIDTRPLWPGCRTSLLMFQCLWFCFTEQLSYCSKVCCLKQDSFNLWSIFLLEKNKTKHVSRKAQHLQVTWDTFETHSGSCLDSDQIWIQWYDEHITASNTWSLFTSLHCGIKAITSGGNPYRQGKNMQTAHRKAQSQPRNWTHNLSAMWRHCRSACKTCLDEWNLIVIQFC